MGSIDICGVDRKRLTVRGCQTYIGTWFVGGDANCFSTARLENFVDVRAEFQSIVEAQLTGTQTLRSNDIVKEEGNVVCTFCDQSFCPNETGQKLDHNTYVTKASCGDVHVEAVHCDLDSNFFVISKVARHNWILKKYEAQHIVFVCFVVYFEFVWFLIVY